MGTRVYAMAYRDPIPCLPVGSRAERSMQQDLRRVVSVIPSGLMTCAVTSGQRGQDRDGAA